MTHPDHAAKPQATDDLPPVGPIKVVGGGALMGVANVIPGVSGGTLLLAVGIYQHFVTIVADLTRLRLSRKAIMFMAMLGAGLVVGIGLSVGPVTWGITHHHHVMYALFIGLTLGGAPLLLREIKPLKPEAIIGTVIGLAGMIGFTLFTRTEGFTLPDAWWVWAIAGFLASVAMVLPGISGSLLLLVVGLYRPLMGGIKEFLSALKGMDINTMWQLSITMMIPTGLGVVAGIAGLTNVLKWMLHRQHDLTIGTLLGLLIGSTFPLYPFGPLVEKGELLREAHPATPLNILIVVVALAAGVAFTTILARLDAKKTAGADA